MQRSFGIPLHRPPLPTRLLAALMLLLAGSHAGAETADRILRNGKIYTVDPAQPWAEAVAIRNGAIIAVGSNESMAGLTGDGTAVIDLGGRMVLPGLMDVHQQHAHRSRHQRVASASSPPASLSTTTN